MDLFSAKKILLCLRYGIGDVVMETPVLSYLREAVPNARITALGAMPSLELLENDPRVDELVCVHNWGLTHWGDTGNQWTREYIREWLSMRQFEVVLDPSHAVGAVRDVVYEQKIKAYDSICKIQNTGLIEGKNGVESIIAAANRCWGFEIPEELKPYIPLGLEDVIFAERFVRNAGFHEQPLVGICPVASSSLKQWPLDRFAEISDRIIEDTGANLLLFCGPQTDAATVMNACMYQPGRTVTVATYKLGKIAALLARCSFLVTNDTGIMHVAGAVNTPVLGIFGPTSPRIYLPPGDCIAVESNIPCRWRRDFEFGPSECLVSNRCMAGRDSCICAISISRIQNAIQFFINQEEV